MDGGMAESENVFCDDPSMWSEECVMECLSLGSGSESSVEHSPGYREKQMEANRASLRASLLTDFDRETFVSLAQHVAGDSVKEMPPFRIVRYPDLMEQAWGWERLVPYDGSVDMPTYVAYLQLYYRKNSLEYVVTGDQKPEEWPLKNDGARGQIALGNGLAAVANICLKSELELVSEWNKRAESRVNVVTVALSNLIQDWAHSIIRAGEFSDACAAALVCLIKEAYLICELLRRGANLNDCYIKQSSEIRMCALSLMNCKGQQSDAAAAAMVGMAQEAKMMCAWMKEEDMLLDSHSVDVPEEISDCETIRFRTLDFMASILQETSLSSFASETDHGGNVTATAAKYSGCVGGEMATLPAEVAPEELIGHEAERQRSQHAASKSVDAKESLLSKWKSSRSAPKPALKRRKSSNLHVRFVRSPLLNMMLVSPRARHSGAKHQKSPSVIRDGSSSTTLNKSPSASPSCFNNVNQRDELSNDRLTFYCLQSCRDAMPMETLPPDVAQQRSMQHQGGKDAESANVDRIKSLLVKRKSSVVNASKPPAGMQRKSSASCVHYVRSPVLNRMLQSPRMSQSGSSSSILFC